MPALVHNFDPPGRDVLLLWKIRSLPGHYRFRNLPKGLDFFPGLFSRRQLPKDDTKSVQKEGRSIQRWRSKTAIWRLTNRHPRRESKASRDGSPDSTTIKSQYLVSKRHRICRCSWFHFLPLVILNSLCEPDCVGGL